MEAKMPSPLPGRPLQQASTRSWNIPTTARPRLKSKKGKSKVCKDQHSSQSMPKCEPVSYFGTGKPASTQKLPECLHANETPPELLECCNANETAPELPEYCNANETPSELPESREAKGTPSELRECVKANETHPDLPESLEAKDTPSELPESLHPNENRPELPECLHRSETPLWNILPRVRPQLRRKNRNMTGFEAKKNYPQGAGK